MVHHMVHNVIFAKMPSQKSVPKKGVAKKQKAIIFWGNPLTEKVSKDKSYSDYPACPTKCCLHWSDKMLNIRSFVLGAKWRRIAI